SWTTTKNEFLLSNTTARRDKMAYDVNTDYKAKQNEIKKQMDAETDPVKKAALQVEFNAAGQSRNEKLASNLQKYGKYATDSELDSAAGIQANNQIGTTYENQAKAIGDYYDTAQQNANNDALSRGMARSSFVSDRMARLDTKRADALTSNDAAKALAIQNAKASILNNYQTNAANALTNQKSEYANNIGAYYNDYQQEINNVMNNNDASDDWKVPYLQAARQKKIHDTNSAQATADQQAFENQLALEKLAISSSKSYRSGRRSSGRHGSSGNDGGDDGNPDNNPNPFGGPPKTKLNDVDASYQVGMNRTKQGQKATVDRLYDSGQITEAQANALYDKFKIDS
ncbi:MAG: hypothetical protein ACRC1I_00700, partial [Pseudomonas proteolytica]|uniref:hypothetical protein n=1 Tax=Pseudomonas proteolytica TaxID=219574 RepID=UPI003F31C526